MNTTSTSSISGAQIAHIITGVHNAMTKGGEGLNTTTLVKSSRMVWPLVGVATVEAKDNLQCQEKICPK